MGTFAQIENDIIINVIVADNDFISTLDGKFIEVEEKPDAAGIGFIFNEKENILIPPQPFKSWVLNKENKWEPPVDKPKDIKREEIDYIWDEKNAEWEQVLFEKKGDGLELKRPNKKSNTKDEEIKADTETDIKEIKK